MADYSKERPHIASRTDVEHAYEVGGPQSTTRGKERHHAIIIRTQDNPYAWAVGETDLNKVANIVAPPSDFIEDDGFSVTEDLHI